ncbi:M56 family metallopeptidase [Niabella drilacis]|uniref:BlaR1 peptidase M56 n=1 Tax=Niabella drilacis (strain DSM 25811 / CCM 8410 / CCUG 62505 / LMG 26954 / E90) TaxID=1285928 RepID=A0A1G6ZJQ4_NIADE|nr:M56 family metallopeptidase [Niabella drilacis]SDE02557.1 BlaR1 peptidase M56 [Niabella drilacis]
MQEGLYHVFTALGNALFSSVWQMGIIWLLITIYIYLRPATSDATGSLLRFAGLVTGFILFLVTFFNALHTPQTASGPLKWMTRPDWVRPLLNYGAVLYLALLILPLRNILKNSLQLRQLRKNGIGRVPGVLKIFMLDAAGYLNIKRKVQLYASSIISSPLTIGFLKPVILLPVALINQLTPQQLEAIILHELAHIKRNDYLINLISQIIITFLYFNPFARLLVNARELDCERSADRWVLRFEYGQYMYASTLLQLARGRSAGNGFVMRASGKESQLSNRVAAIMGSPRKETFPLKKTGMLACLLLLSGGLYLIRTTRPQPQANMIAFAPTSQSWTPATAAQYSTLVSRAENTADTDAQKYSIRPIPAIEKPDTRPGDNAIYLKIHESPDGRVQAPAPPPPPPATPASEPIVLFADHPTFIVPDLDSTAEEQVQQSMGAFKKLVGELSWKHVENSLAETVTEAQKKVLKDKLNQLLAQVDWNQNANLLRSFYKEINWQQTDEQLKANLDALFQAQAARSGTLKQMDAKDYRQLADSLLKQVKTTHHRTDSLHQQAPLNKAVDL